LTPIAIGAAVEAERCFRFVIVQYDGVNPGPSRMMLVSIPGNPCPDGAVTSVIQTPDGVTLRFARWGSPVNANGAIKGTVCIFAGRGEFIEKYFETVGELRQRGFVVATMDWRGQGHSSRQLPDPRKGHVENFQDFEVDLETFMLRVVKSDCPPPYYALAHSMGGSVMLRAAHAGKRWFERMVLLAPLIDLPPPRSSWPLRLLMRTLRRTGFGDSYVPGSNVDRTRASGFPGNPLTSDPQRYARNAALLAQDPTLGIGSPTVAWLDAAFDTMVEFGAADYPSQIVSPVLMVAAGADTVVSAAAVKAFCARLPAGSHLAIEGARHEILQEADVHRAQFWAAFDAFVPGAVVQIAPEGAPAASI
jgi:lysophospholipase